MHTYWAMWGLQDLAASRSAFLLDVIGFGRTQLGSRPGTDMQLMVTHFVSCVVLPVKIPITSIIYICPILQADRQCLMRDAPPPFSLVINVCLMYPLQFMEAILGTDCINDNISQTFITEFLHKLRKYRIGVLQGLTL